MKMAYRKIMSCLFVCTVVGCDGDGDSETLTSTIENRFIQAIGSCQIADPDNVRASIWSGGEQYEMNISDDGSNASISLDLSQGQRIQLQIEYIGDTSRTTIFNSSKIIENSFVAFESNDFSVVDSDSDCSQDCLEYSVFGSLDSDDAGRCLGNQRWEVFLDVPQVTLRGTPAIDLNNRVVTVTTPDQVLASTSARKLTWIDNDSTLIMYNNNNITGSMERAPIVDTDGNVYVSLASLNRSVLSYDASGEFRWSFPGIPGAGDIGELRTISLSNSGVLAVGTCRTESGVALFGLDKTNGNVIWEWADGDSSTTKACIISKPAISTNGQIYVTSSNTSFLYAIDVENGDSIWKVGTSRSVSSPAIDLNGNVIVAGGTGLVQSFSPTDGNLNWEYLTGNEIKSSPIIDSENNVYLVSRDGFMYSLDDNGNLRWQFQLGTGDAEGLDRSGGNGTPALTENGSVYFAEGGNTARQFYAIDKDSGLLRWERTIVGGSISVSRTGEIYIYSNNRLVSLIGDSPLSTTAPWPKYGKDLGNTAQ